MKTSTQIRILCLLAIFLQASPMGFSQAVPQEKDFVLEVVERNREAIALLGDNIFYFAELGMQPFLGCGPGQPQIPHSHGM